MKGSKFTILAEGLTSREQNREAVPTDQLMELRKNAVDADTCLGYRSTSFEGFPDNRMDGVDLLDVTHAVEKHIDQLRPHLILTHHHSDLNVDHQITCQAVLTAARPVPGSGVVAIATFETPSSTEWNFPYHKSAFSPNLFVDITGGIEKKSKLCAFIPQNPVFRRIPDPVNLWMPLQDDGAVLSVVLLQRLLKWFIFWYTEDNIFGTADLLSPISCIRFFDEVKY